LKIVKHIDLGTCDYKKTWEFQKKLRDQKYLENTDDYLITVEHPPVYTLGRNGKPEHILINKDEMTARGISYYETDRGGDITFHGPGQLVVYPIFNLINYYKDVHRFLRELEQTVIDMLAKFSITAGRVAEYTGVWVNDRKICAIGINVSRWITMHGLALNVNNDLSYFRNIIPCGIVNKDITSMKEELGTDVDITEVKKSLLRSFSETFGIILQ
jgi:lipoyl(octanoyl) transferase